jgi:nitrogen fixation protein FixH
MTTQHPAPSAIAIPPRLGAFMASGRIWAWVPALLLGGLLGTQLFVLRSALDDPSFSTEEDYYRKAVDWDTHMTRERQSLALGWLATAQVSASPGARSALSVRLRDAHDAAVSLAGVRAVAFHNARAAHPLALALVESKPGEYGADLGAARPGLWELRLSVTRGADSYETTVRFEVPAGAP